jgi:hypothetical protein
MTRLLSIVLLLTLLLPGAAQAQTDTLCFVQFIHPGLEHQPDTPSGRSWNTAPHRRKFLLNPGRYQTALAAAPQSGHLVFWGEYEPPTHLVQTYPVPVSDGPQYLFTPAPVPFYPNDPPLMNTDPFVFGNHFIYSICKQNNKRGPTAMQRLARGSVILFGSGRDRNRFVVDTVFVVRDYVDCTLNTYREQLADIVPPEYFHAALEPIAYETQVRNLTPSATFRLYIGATVEKPFAGMYSFFPCLPAADGQPQGFARPAIRRPGIITDNLTQGQRMNPQSDLAAVQELWQDVAQQILAQGLALGVHADLPRLP